MIRKRASFTLTDVVPYAQGDSGTEMIRTAARKIGIDANLRARSVVDSELKKHPTALFFRAKAIVADEPNSNGDMFPKDELKKSAHTFVGVPFCTNHNNKDIEQAKGKIVYAEWDENDSAIYVIGFVDREAYPHICRGIEHEYMTGVSMGALNGSAMIRMADGAEKPISEIGAGETVMSAYGRPCKVLKTHCEYLGKPMFSFGTGTYHKSPMFTEDHPLMVVEKTENGYDRGFIRTSSVEIGDCVVVPSKFCLKPGSSIPPEMCYLIGAYLGSGFLEKDKAGRLCGIRLCVESGKRDFEPRLMDAVKACSEGETAREDRNGLCITVFDGALAEWMSKNAGTGSKKRIGFKIDREDDARHILVGYIDMGGRMDWKKRQEAFGGFGVSGSNLGLLEDAQSLLISLGYAGRICKSEKDSEMIGTETYVLSSDPSGVSSVIDIGGRKCMLCPVKEISKTDSYDEPVYDLSVEGDECYVADGMAVHNCSVEYSECSICGNVATTAENYCEHIKFRKSRKFTGSAKNVKTGEIKKFKDAPVYEVNYNVRFIELSGVMDPACHDCRIEGVIAKDESLEKAAACACGMKKSGQLEEAEYSDAVIAAAVEVVMGKISRSMLIPDEKLDQAIDIVERNENRIEKVNAHGQPYIPTQPDDIARMRMLIREFSDRLPVAASVSNIQNGLLMYKDAAIEKNASQEELQKIEQCLSTLEEISINLIRNRKKVETEFATDLVQILSDLQKFTDELVGAGYGQMPPAENAIPGLEGAPEGAPAELPPEAQTIPTPASPMAQPLTAETEAPVGANATGVPGTPAIIRPTMPTPPAWNLASSDALNKVGNAISRLKTAAFLEESQVNAAQEGSEKDMKRRTPTSAAADRAAVKQILESSLKEKQAESENKVHHEAGFNAKGGSTMSDIKHVAERQDAPETITEKQLDGSVKYHPRTDDSKHEITQKQLKEERNDAEPTSISEKQLEGSRTDGTPTVISEKQLEKVREGVDKHTVTQDQLESEGYKSGEKEVVTEKQLDTKPTDIWSRAAFSRKNIKTAQEHLDGVLAALAGAAIATGSTPEDVKASVAGLVGDVRSKTATLDAITSPVTDGDRVSAKDILAKAKYWSQRGIVVAAKDLAGRIVSGLRVLVAEDEGMSAEDIMDTVDVLADDKDSAKEISLAIDKMAAEGDKPAAAASRKDEIRKALASKKVVKADTKPPVEEDSRPRDISGRKDRDQERGAMKDKLARKATHRISATPEEVGTTKEEVVKNSSEAKRKIVAFVNKIASMDSVEVDEKVGGQFVKKASTLKNAGILNVKFDGEQLHIAVEVGGEKADLSIPADETAPASVPVEGDVTGENLDALAQPADQVSPPVPPPVNAPLPTAAAKVNMEKKAQFGGGTGGGLPGTTPGGVGDPAAAGAMPNASPAMDQAVQSLTAEAPKTEEELPGPGEQMMPGTVCPICHSTDTEVGAEGRPAGQFTCNGCGAVYEMHVMIEVLNPEKMTFEKDKADADKKIEAPELPSMPVAASIKLTKDSLQKIASYEAKIGHVCPACGMTGCKPVSKSAGRTEYVCPSCETRTAKDTLVSKDDPSDAAMMVSWTLDPKKSGKANCETCRKAARKFAAQVNVARMIRTAAETPFPMANCVERINRKWGSNSVATYGPCKGKPLAECACKQLAAFGMRDVGDMNRIASTYAMRDPMDECLEIHQNGKMGRYNEAQAGIICKEMQRKYAKEQDSNEFLMAFADSKKYATEELRVMKDKWTEMIRRQAQALDEMNDDTDIGEPLPAAGEPEIPDTVTIELPAGVAEDVKEQIAEKTEEAPAALASEEVVVEAAPEAPAVEPAPAVVASAKPVVKTADKPKKVEDGQHDVKSGVPRGNAAIKNEGPDNIDVKPKTPDIPRGDAAMGGESKDNIDVKIDLPDIPVDDAKMGGEKETQKDMPAVNVEIRGRVIAEAKPATKTAAKPTKVVDGEKDVEAGVPRGNAEIMNEGKDNINVVAKDPDIPRGDARMGNEGPDNIDVKADLPDIPVDDAKMGGEKETQKDMPAINNEIRGRVIAEKRDRQMERIAAARHKKACQVASKLLGQGRIAEADFDAVVEDLSKIEADRIEAFADRVFKAASQASPTTLPSPIVQEASSYADERKPKEQKSLKDTFAGWFTVGTPALDKEIRGQDAE